MTSQLQVTSQPAGQAMNVPQSVFNSTKQVLICTSCGRTCEVPRAILEHPERFSLFRDNFERKHETC